MVAVRCFLTFNVAGNPGSRGYFGCDFAVFPGRFSERKFPFLEISYAASEQASFIVSFELVDVAGYIFCPNARPLPNNKPMLGLFLLYFVGKAFYDLAGADERSRWFYAILGVASYYGGLIVGGIVIALVYDSFIGSIDDVNDTLLGIMAIPIGVLSCWGFYRLLKSRWSKRETFSDNSEEVLDATFIDPNSDKTNPLT